MVVPKFGLRRPIGYCVESPIDTKLAAARTNVERGNESDESPRPLIKGWFVEKERRTAESLTKFICTVTSVVTEIYEKLRQRFRIPPKPNSRLVLA
jgi:hypothetical protein